MLHATEIPKLAVVTKGHVLSGMTCTMAIRHWHDVDYMCT